MNNNTYNQTSSSALLKIAGSTGAGSQISCSYRELRGRALSLELSQSIESRTAVAVEHQDALYLGEVVRALESEGKWHVEIRVEQILSGLTSLLALRDSLLCERTVNPLAAALAGTTR